MHNSSICKGAASVAYHMQQNLISHSPWKLRWKPICASTELDLSRWLDETPFLENIPRAFLAGRQSFGRGQYGRSWQAPAGGVWVSAAIPFPANQTSVGIFSLAVAVALAQKLEESCIPVQIKWPNDLIVNQKKLAGILPRLVYRGKSIQYARVGIGLNVLNKVPEEAISLRYILGKNNLSVPFVSAITLLSLESATMLLKDKNNLCNEVKRLLWTKQLIDPQTRRAWSIDGVNFEGELLLRRGFKRKAWKRW